VVCIAHLLGLQVIRQLGNQPVGRNGMLLFSRQTLPGTGLSMAGHWEAFLGLGVQDVAEFNSG
jgi:hypothetical protein